MDNVYFIPDYERYIYVPAKSSIIADLIGAATVPTNSLSTLDFKLAQENIMKVKEQNLLEPYTSIIAVFQCQNDAVPKTVAAGNYVAMLIDDRLTDDPEHVLLEIDIRLNPKKGSIYMTGKAEKEPDMSMLERGAIKMSRVWTDDISQKRRVYNSIASMVRDDFRDPKMAEGRVIPPLLEAHIEYWVGQETAGMGFQEKWKTYKEKYPDKMPSDEIIDEMLMEYMMLMKEPVDRCCKTMDQVKGHLGLTELEYPLYEEVQEFMRVVEGSIGISKMLGIMSGRQKICEDDALMIMRSILGEQGLDELLKDHGRIGTNLGEKDYLEKMAGRLKGADPEMVKAMFRRKGY
jgi:hypothetical protein